MVAVPNEVNKKKSKEIWQHKYKNMVSKAKKEFEGLIARDTKTKYQDIKTNSIRSRKSTREVVGLLDDTGRSENIVKGGLGDSRETKLILCINTGTQVCTTSFPGKMSDEQNQIEMMRDCHKLGLFID